MTGPATPSTQEGPTESPPHLPEGWLAQWESQSKKYYYVQRATGISTWDIPTQPAPSVPTPGPTPQQAGDPFPQPSGAAHYGGGSDAGTRKHDDPAGNYQGADRSFLSDMALNAATGGKHKPQKQSGLTGIASSFLGGQGSHGSGGHSGGGGGIAGQLVGSLLGGGKPHGQQSSAQHSGAGGGSAGAHQQGGLIGLASGFLGGHPGSTSQNTNYGYSASLHGSGGGYSAQAPPTAYQPPNQQGSAQYGSTSGQYNPSGQAYPQIIGGQTPGYPAPPAYGQAGHGQPGQSYTSTQAGYGESHPSLASPPPTQYGGSGPGTPAYGQPAPSYSPHPQGQGYSPYPAQGQQQHPPAPQQTPSYQGQPGGYDSYGPHQGSTPSQYPPSSGAGYPGQQNYGGQGGQGQTYGQPPPQGGYGQQGNYGGSGAPPAPGWRA